MGFKSGVLVEGLKVEKIRLYISCVAMQRVGVTI